MPILMASHWGIEGLVDGYSSKLFALFFIPCLLLVMYPLFSFLPKVEPYKKNFKEFERYYNIFISLFFCFLLYVYILIIIWNLNIQFNMLQFLSPAFAVILYYAGLLSSKTKMNWFVGIRTPWAYKNKNVWQKTQDFGGKMFKISALICLLSLVLPTLTFYFIFVPIIIIIPLVFIYSYLEAKKYK